MRNSYVSLMLFFLALPFIGSSQENSSNELYFEVHKVYPPLSISKENLGKANTIIDLNKYYKPSWVREYISVEVLASLNGNVKKMVNKNEVLTQEQKDLMSKADIGSNISVNVRYIPENTLKQNDPKELDFTFIIDPDNDAKYPGGQKQLQQYLKESVMDEIPADSFQGYDLTTVKFTITEDGQIEDAHVFWPTQKEKTEELLLKAIQNMPNWEPATYSNGLKVKQEFVLTVGNMENCVVNLLNIRMD